MLDAITGTDCGQCSAIRISIIMAVIRRKLTEAHILESNRLGKRKVFIGLHSGFCLHTRLRNSKLKFLQRFNSFQHPEQQLEELCKKEYISDGKEAKSGNKQLFSHLY